MWNVERTNGEMGYSANWKHQKKKEQTEEERAADKEENIESAGKERGKEGNDSGAEAIGEIWR